MMRFVNIESGDKAYKRAVNTQKWVKGNQMPAMMVPR